MIYTIKGDFSRSPFFISVASKNEREYIVSAPLLAGGTLSLSVFLALPTEEAPSFATRATQEATRLQILAAQRKLIKALEKKQATSPYIA